MKENTNYFDISEPIYSEPDLLLPPEGKAWRNKINGAVYPGAVYLGKILFLNGKHLKKPIVETPDDYELVDITDS